MKMETFKEFSFEAAHQIPPHSDVHGHSFRVAVVVSGESDGNFGWSVSLYDLEEKTEAVRLALDHKYLNAIDGLSVPSLENLARWIWERLAPEVPGLERIKVERGVPGYSEGCSYRGEARGAYADA
ncbi:MAG TPA: 6-carboxytetrahydropterin synthase [Afifellaceae bacterium]|nr:6-carboxytetrahydropterin synthase [Afifellaceae bacterium]